MWLLKGLGVMVALSALLVLTGGPASADTVNCLGFPFFGTINVAVNADVEANGGNCTIGPAGSVNGNIKQTGAGDVLVSGRVDGNIEESGPGNVVVFFGGSVDGNIKEEDQGFVAVAVDSSVTNKGSFNGNIEESGNIEAPGGGFVSIFVAASHLFNGNVNEKGPGDLVTFGPGRFNGNTKEEDGGVCANFIPAANFNGKACE